MDFLRSLESIRTGAGDTLMSMLTYLGGETFFLALVLVLYWCVNKRVAYRMLVAAYAGIVCNQFLKLAFRIPRPWVLDPNFTIVESARAEATGYSFPSGHTTNITAIGITLFMYLKRRWQRVLCLLAIVLVAFSRMYLGVHTPLDVCAALLITAIIVVIINRLFDAVEKQGNLMYAVLGGVLLLSVAYLLYAGLWKFPADVDVINLESGKKTACTMLGATLGFILGYYLDDTRIKFPEKAPLPVQIIKTIVGLGIIAGIKLILKSPLNAAFGIFAGQIIRYFIIAVFAAAIWPMTFRPMAGIFQKKR